MFYSAKQLKQKWGVEGNSFKKRLQYNLKSKKLTKIRKGLYVETSTIPFLQEQDRKYAGNSIYSPSYLSFESILQEAGATFQYDTTLTYAGPYSKELSIDKYNVVFKYTRLPNKLLVDPTGIIQDDGISKAFPERALCDLLWYDLHYPLDSLKPFDKKTLRMIAKLYGQYKPQIEKRIKELFTL